MKTCVFLATEVILESKDIKKSFSLESTSNWIEVLSEITIDLAVKLCGAIGVITKFLESGAITGPLQLREYPVEPVGVAMIKPSAQ